MPAILREVLKTNTFEEQRQIINTLADDFHAYSSGTGFSTFLNLVDGSVTSPALFFDSDNSLGLYKADTETLGVVSSSNKVFTFTKNRVDTFKKFIIQNSLIDSVSISNDGNYYRAGSYEVPVTGGSGSNAFIELTVSAFEANITNSGSGYPAGVLTDVTITSGSGTGGTADITVAGIEGNITNGGTGYPAEISYVDVPFSGGNGSGGLADVVVDASGVIVSVIVSNSGTGYLNGDILTFNNADLNYVDSLGNPQSSTGSNFSYTITNVPYIVTDVSPSTSWEGKNYLINDNCGISGTATGNGLSFTLTDVGYISNVTSVSDGGDGYSIGDNVSPTAVRGGQDQWIGIIETYNLNVQVQDIGGGVNRYFIDIGDGNG